MARKRQISMREFSRLAGVSTSTVSRVFSRPDMVAAETRDHVLRLARRKGFRPSPVARAAVGGSTHSVGVLLPDLSVSYFADMIHGIQAGLLADDYLPVVLTNDNDTGLRGVQRLLDHRVDALIFGVSDESIRQDELVAITGSHFPLVVVDQPHPGFDYDCVLNDDDGGGYQAGRHLAELGHRRVGCIRYGEGTSNCEARLAGCWRALAEAGIQTHSEDIVQAAPRGTREDIKRALHSDLAQLLQRDTRPTAIFATTDSFATDVLAVAAQLGIRIPEDLSLVGFADLRFAEFVSPPLTTIRQNGEEVGRQAVELVMSRLAHPERECRRVTIPTRLVVRASTCPHP